MLLYIAHKQAPYVLTKPFHHSQKEVGRDHYGVTISLKVQHNFELEKEILFTNPSYVFFDRKRAIPHGAGHVPLTADYSIAVDPKYIPLGSTLLAAIPSVDAKGDFSHHEFRIVVAQDIGGAIRGSGHVDVYCGVGIAAQKKAMAFHQYGSLWLLLPKLRE